MSSKYKFRNTQMRLVCMITIRLERRWRTDMGQLDLMRMGGI